MAANWNMIQFGHHVGDVTAAEADNSQARPEPASDGVAGGIGFHLFAVGAAHLHAPCAAPPLNFLDLNSTGFSQPLHAQRETPENAPVVLPQKPHRPPCYSGRQALFSPCSWTCFRACAATRAGDRCRPATAGIRYIRFPETYARTRAMRFGVTAPIQRGVRNKRMYRMRQTSIAPPPPMTSPRASLKGARGGKSWRAWFP